MESATTRVLLKEKIKLEPHLVDKRYAAEIIKKLKSKVEGVCTRHGYILENSVNIHKIAPGAIEIASLSGMVLYDVYFYADICNPSVGSVVKAVVTNTNRFGILLESPPVLDIIIPKNSVDIMSEIDLEEVKIDQEVTVEIIGKKYELRDKKISIVGRALKSEKQAHKPASALALDQHSEDEEEEPVEEAEGEEEAEAEEEEAEAEEEEAEEEEDDSVAGGSAAEFDIFNEDDVDGEEYDMFNSSDEEAVDDD